MESKEKTKTAPEQLERRKSERRVCPDRRSVSERRSDNRQSGKRPRKTLKSWVRSITNARLGVDRRKGERRIIPDRRTQPRSILTKEEIHDLLSS